MWLLTIVILVNGGEKPTKFETRIISTEKQCLAAAKVVERSVGKFGYCDRMINE